MLQALGELVFLLAFAAIVFSVSYGTGLVWITVRSTWGPGPYAREWRERHRRLLGGIGDFLSQW